jgi:CubicO group peptidase (beta-lactamase class C family)
MNSNSTDGHMREFMFRLVLSVASVTLCMAAPALASERDPDPKPQQFEHGLLPRVAFKEHLGRTASITQRMQAWGIPGASIAVIDGGKVVFARAYGLSDNVDKTAATAETLFQAGSISKPVAALGALRLVKEGKLSLDEDVNAKLRTWRVPENEFTKEDKVTLRRLVSHTAGLTVHGFPGYAAGSPVPTVVQVLNGESPANTPPVRVDVRPGSTYRYSGGGYTVMQLLIADVSNESFETFMQSKVLDVLGMKSSTYVQTPPTALAARRASGHRPGGARIPGKLHTYPEMAAAGLWTTASDLAQYLIYVQGAVGGDGSSLLDASLAKEMVTRQQGRRHGLGPVMYEVGEFARFGHDGVDEGFDASMVAYVAQGKGLVIMANVNGSFAFFDEVKGSVARAYDWPGFPRQTQLQAEPVSAWMLQRAPGTYRISPTMTTVLTVKDGRLLFELSDGARFELFAKSATELYGQDGSHTLQVVEIDGKVTALKRSDGIEFPRID